MQNEDIQKELLKETVEPDKALTISIKTEMGTLNQLKMNAIKFELNSTVNQVQRMRIANATPYTNTKSTAGKNLQHAIFVDLVGLRNIVTNAVHVERNAIFVALKITSRGFVENLRILIRIQNLNHVSIMSNEKMVKLMLLIKFRLIMTLI